MRKIVPIEKRFWGKVDKTKSCWIWNGATNYAGYGVIGLGGRDQGNILAHRFSYEIHHGKIKYGNFICHKCDNPPCVNPSHLFQGTNQDNVSDMIRKNRNFSVIGENNHFNKLSKEAIIEIRSQYKRNIIGYKKLAKKYGVVFSCIQAIVNRKNWKHLS